MLINVKNLSGKTISLNIPVPNDCSIYNIKEMIQELESIDPTQQKLIFEGKILDDTKKISDTNIKLGDTLNMMLALRV